MELHPENLKPFVKGDKRINRNGRPKSFDALRRLAVFVATTVGEEHAGFAVLL